MVRDRETGKPKGFCFLKYDDQRSTVLTVDNFNGATLLGRTLRVDHSRDYRQKTKKRRRDDESQSEESEVELDEEGNPRVKGFNVAPKGWLDPPIEEASESEQDDIGQGIDPDDPMRDYLIEKRKEERDIYLGKKRIKEEEDDHERKRKHRRRSSRDGEERHGHRHRHRHRSRRYIEDGQRDLEADSTSKHRQPDHTPRKSLSDDDVTPERSRDG